MGKLDRHKKREKARAETATKRDDRPIGEVAPLTPVATHKADDAPLTALEARARRMGWRMVKDEDGNEYFPRKTLDAAKSPLLSCGVGLAMRDTLSEEAAMQAWQTWADWGGIVHRFRAFKTGKTGQPDSSRFETDRNRAETTDDRGPDLRTWEERFSDAANEWIKWEGYVMRLPPISQTLLRQSLETDEVWATGTKATTKGRSLARAAHDLSEIVADVVDARKRGR